MNGLNYLRDGVTGRPTGNKSRGAEDDIVQSGLNDLCQALRGSLYERDLGPAERVLRMTARKAWTVAQQQFTHQPACVAIGAPANQ